MTGIFTKRKCFFTQYSQKITTSRTRALGQIFFLNPRDIIQSPPNILALATGNDGMSQTSETKLSGFTHLADTSVDLQTVLYFISVRVKRISACPNSQVFNDRPCSLAVTFIFCSLRFILTG